MLCLELLPVLFEKGKVAEEDVGSEVSYLGEQNLRDLREGRPTMR